MTPELQQFQEVATKATAQYTGKIYVIGFRKVVQLAKPQKEHVDALTRAAKALVDKELLNQIDIVIVKCPCELGDCSLCEYLLPRRDELATRLALYTEDGK